MRSVCTHEKDARTTEHSCTYTTVVQLHYGNNSCSSPQYSRVSHSNEWGFAQTNENRIPPIDISFIDQDVSRAEDEIAAASGGMPKRHLEGDAHRHVVGTSAEIAW